MRENARFDLKNFYWTDVSASAASFHLMTRTERNHFATRIFSTIFLGAIFFLTASLTAIQTEEQKLPHVGKGPLGNRNVVHQGRQTSAPNRSRLTFVENMGQTAEQV